MRDLVLVLTEARARVAHRWTQGAAMDSLGGVCAAQAVAMSLGFGDNLDVLQMDALHALLNAADRLGQGQWGSVPSWNDWSGRTKEQVLAVFDKAIADRTPRVNLHLVAVPKPMPTEVQSLTDQMKELVGV